MCPKAHLVGFFFLVWGWVGFFLALSACLIEDNTASYKPSFIWAAGTQEVVKAERPGAIHSASEYSVQTSP